MRRAFERRAQEDACQEGLNSLSHSGRIGPKVANQLRLEQTDLKSRSQLPAQMSVQGHKRKPTTALHTSALLSEADIANTKPEVGYRRNKFGSQSRLIQI